ncbi:BA14K family protein [Methylobacterium sp. J-030]|uniref:BA14K family protein n=1 Tax=Methylobacterium sp. J-030 TaxID=2836627 RepID=UPI001FB9D34F|nr:BA14K family protein [Methylobacterium sp. J-030]MCJ2070680.1 BA14K family protein [Methylobacterium sp. J-030]
MYRTWRRRDFDYRYGVGGFGLGLGLGGLFGSYGDPWYDGDAVYTPPVYGAPVAVPVETEVATDDPAAIADCARRFKTYDPRTRTYIGKGHIRRRCP